MTPADDLKRLIAEWRAKDVSWTAIADALELALNEVDREWVGEED